MVEKANHAAMAGRAMANLTDSSRMAVEKGEKESYLPPSSEQRAARSQKNDAQSQLIHTYRPCKSQEVRRSRASYRPF
jgi:hypothetical protein